MARVLLSKGKERAKAKIKAGQKANAAKPAKFSMSDTQVRYASGKPVVTAASKKAAAPVKKATAVKKVEPKKAEPKKVETKKSAAKPINKELVNKMTKSGQSTYLDVKNKKVVKAPTTKETVKKVATDSKNKQTKKVKSIIESLKRPEIKKKETKPEVPKTTTPSVSQLWQQKTGTSWSEAKKQGLTDGTASANIALMKKLKSGEINKESIKTPKPGTAASMDAFKKEMEKNIQSELSGETTYEPPVPAMRRGGSVRKVRKSVIVKRRK